MRNVEMTSRKYGNLNKSEFSERFFPTLRTGVNFNYFYLPVSNFNFSPTVYTDL